MYFLSKVAFTVAVSTLVANAAVPVAHAFPAGDSAAVGHAPSGIVKIHDERRTYRRYHRGYHRYAREHVVDAPFAHVESGEHTVVDAPFVHVYRGRHGQHIVAPFVDLWEPR
jgi:hypothetical protein